MDRRTSWGVGLAMNARGAMEMILGLLALEYGLIREPMFVALVVMALFTSLISAPALHFLIRRRRMLRLKDLVSNKLFLQELDHETKREVIEQMCTFAANAVGNARSGFSAWSGNGRKNRRAGGETASRFPMPGERSAPAGRSHREVSCGD